MELGTTMESMDGPDLSRLPDDVLVHVFQMLPLSDRARLASCCRRLCALMHHPSLWTHVTLGLRVAVDTKTRTVKKQEITKIYWTMTRKYGQYFRNVHVVMNSGVIGTGSLEVLSNLCQRQVIKRVTLSYDLFHCQLVELTQENGEYDELLFYLRDMICQEALTPVDPRFIERLSPDTHFTVELLPQHHDSESITANALYLEFANIFFTHAFYSRPKSEFCSLLKRLILSTNLTSEKDFANMEPQGTATPTAALVSSFPNLEELHVNIVSLSDQLLLELSGASGKRSPLRCLVIRHIDSKLQMYISLGHALGMWPLTTHDSSFPQLSSAAWKQLANASPSLKVECCLRIDELPELSEIIRPETPLVKLQVVCKNSTEESAVGLYQDLGKNHCETLQHLDLSIRSDTDSRHTERMQRELKDMLLACSRLQHLVCDVDLCHQHLDEVTDSRRWTTLRFNPSRIITDQDMGEGAVSDPTSPWGKDRMES